MRGIEKMKARVADLINKEIQKTQKEIAEFEDKIHDNEVYYGCGGWYTQFNNAKVRREEYLEQLQHFADQQGTTVQVDTIYLHSYYCRRCNTKISLDSNYGEKVHCPVCEMPIYKCNDGEEMKIVRGSRIAKVNGHFVQLASDGRLKE